MGKRNEEGGDTGVIGSISWYAECERRFGINWGIVEWNITYTHPYTAHRKSEREKQNRNVWRSAAFDVQQRWALVWGKNFKFDVLCSVTIFLLVLLLLLQRGRFLVRTLLCQLNFDILFSHQLVWQRARKFYPIHELQFILARSLAVTLFHSVLLTLCIALYVFPFVSGALKFVVNGFLMQISYSIWPIVNNAHFHIRIFMSVWGIVAVAVAFVDAILFSHWDKSSRIL